MPSKHAASILPCDPKVWREYRRAVVNGERPRDYAISAECYENRPKRKAARNARHSNRSKFTKAGLVAVGDGREIHHVNHNPLDNRLSNLQVLSAVAHRKQHSRERRRGTGPTR